MDVEVVVEVGVVEVVVDAGVVELVVEVFVAALLRLPAVVDLRALELSGRPPA
jgi:hypothetical protein